MRVVLRSTKRPSSKRQSKRQPYASSLSLEEAKFGIGFTVIHVHVISMSTMRFRLRVVGLRSGLSGRCINFSTKFGYNSFLRGRRIEIAERGSPRVVKLFVRIQFDTPSRMRGTLQMMRNRVKRAHRVVTAWRARKWFLAAALELMPISTAFLMVISVSSLTIFNSISKVYLFIYSCFITMFIYQRMSKKTILSLYLRKMPILWLHKKSRLFVDF